MTGKEWAMDKLMMEEEKLIRKFCPGDFGITTEESKSVRISHIRERAEDVGKVR